MIMSFILESVGDEYPNLDLPHNIQVIVGRNQDSKVKDTQVSRKQVELVANNTKKRVTIKQLGTNNCMLDGDIIGKGISKTASPGSTLELLEGKYPYIIKFSGNSDCDNSPGHINTSKRKRGRDSDDEAASSRDRKGSDNTQPLKRVKSDPFASDSDSADDDEETKRVKENLKQMKESAKSTNHKAGPSTSKGESANLKKTAKDSGSSRVVEPTKEDKWEEAGEKFVLFTARGVVGRDKIASFDIDGTIITTKSGKVFPKDLGDWRFLYPEVPGRLKKLHNDGYKVVFITNQKGIARGKMKLDDFKQKVELIVSKVGAPIQVAVSVGLGGKYRKPVTGMWEYLVNYGNQGVDVDISASMYIGDAAGRPDKWEPGKKKDFSCSDRLFALNVGVPFQTPEEFFLKKRAAPFNLPEFDPRNIDVNKPLFDSSDTKVTSQSQEIILLSGFPACGKSHFVREYLLPKGYIHVNRDTLGTWQKCVKAAEKALVDKKCVVIDNTNPDVESRKRYIDVAKKCRVPCRCFVFDVTFTQVKHNEKFREMTDKSHQAINEMILNSFKSKYKKPEKSEGFAEVAVVNFVPKFKRKDDQQLYQQFLVEK